MANILADRVLDLGLNVIDTEADKISIVSADPTTYTEAVSTNALGIHDFASPGAAFGAPAAGSPNGRKVTSNAISGESVTASGTATGWAVVDSANSRLLANGDLASSQAVTSGNTFNLPAFAVQIPNQ